MLYDICKAVSPGAKLFVVGGFVRDTALGFKPKDMDLLLVGASPEDFVPFSVQTPQVGKDFPVFLLTLEGETFEVALARTERKVGTGYTGFTCDTRGVTLEEDLMRRDFTVNALAQEVLEGGALGPVQGLPGALEDLEARRLRACSEAFAEDPLRVLRMARFASRGFSVEGE